MKMNGISVKLLCEFSMLDQIINWQFIYIQQQKEYFHLSSFCIYIYIYIDRLSERERERGRGKIDNTYIMS